MLSTGSAKILKRTLLMLLNRFMFGWISDGTLTFILINLHSEIQSLEKVRYVPFLPCELCKSTTSRFTKFNAIITAFTTLKKLVAILRHNIHYCSIGPCYIRFKYCYYYDFEATKKAAQVSKFYSNKE